MTDTCAHYCAACKTDAAQRGEAPWSVGDDPLRDGAADYAAGELGTGNA